MHFPTVVLTLTWSLAVVASYALPSDSKAVHHSTKKQLREPPRLPRKTAEGEATDLDPAIAYALPPAGLGLLHHGQGFGFGLGQGKGFETDLAALVSSGLQLQAQEAHQDLQDPGRRPVLHATPLQPYPVVFNRDHAGPSTVQPELKVAKVVETEAHNFVDAPKYHHSHHEEEEYKDYAAKYQFGYRVRDLHTGNDFGQTESRDGHMTQGHYHVLLPDGRLQSVNYWSDDSGFHAKVSYDGHAHH